MIKVDCLLACYRCELEQADAQALKRLLERESANPDGQTLGEEIEALSWAGEVFYGEEFGLAILVDDIQRPTPDRLSEIVAIIQRHLSQD